MHKYRSSKYSFIFLFRHFRVWDFFKNILSILVNRSWFNIIFHSRLCARLEATVYDELAPRQKIKRLKVFLIGKTTYNLYLSKDWKKKTRVRVSKKELSAKTSSKSWNIIEEYNKRIRHYWHKWTYWCVSYV